MNNIPKLYILLLLICVLSAASTSFPQAAKRKNTAKAPAGKTQPAPTIEPGEPAPAAPAKKNGRPAPSEAETAQTRRTADTAPSSVSYSYEFSRPAFVVPYILIRHDDTGKGTISFKKQGLEQPESDPIQWSAVTLTRINDAIAALNFLDSSASYQYEKDYSHLGNVTFTYQKDGRERSTKFNWTENKDARALADEYRKIANQYVWQFDIAGARQSQPLESPQLMGVLDGYLKRGEISDPKQMLPLLKELSNDERIPLIARNHAARLAAAIEKTKK